METSRTHKKPCASCGKVKQNRVFYKKKYSYDNVCMACRRLEQSMKYHQAEKMKRELWLCNTEIMTAKRNPEGGPWLEQYKIKMEAIRNAK